MFEKKNALRKKKEKKKATGMEKKTELSIVPYMKDDFEMHCFLSFLFFSLHTYISLLSTKFLLGLAMVFARIQCSLIAARLVAAVVRCIRIVCFCMFVLLFLFNRVVNKPTLLNKKKNRSFVRSSIRLFHIKCTHSLCVRCCSL